MHISDELLGLLIPLGFFLATVAVVWIVVSFRHRTQREVQQTFRAAIERGQELTPDLLDRLGEPKSGDRDLRRGLVFAAIGLGFAVFAVVLDEQDAVRPLLAVGAFPLLLGCAYLGLWRFNREPS